MHTGNTPLWRDRRFWRIAIQGLVVGLLVIVAGLLWSNLNRNLQQLGIQLGFGFLDSQAGFSIGESPIAYQPSNTYTRAILVGFLNTLRVMLAGILLATIVGVIAGVARLSENWLVRQLARLYVEVLRNTPLLLHLFFWYFAVFAKLPSVDKPVRVLGSILLTNRGVTLPGGMQLSPEFVALLAGLTFYTGTFIAEIVRGGIQSVPTGQWEAAQALGLSPGLTLRQVIFPQALRAIVPPLANQYLNLAKNSSLGVAIGYPDLYAISTTTFNQTGRAVEAMLLIMATYLTISLTIAWVMNAYNRRVQLVER